jgi:glycosyltransferase involved in cell wall biosynthesis
VNAIELSIITVVKDDLTGFKRTFESLDLANQGSIQIVVVDSSQDESILKEINSHKTRHEYINYFRMPARGIYPAMNFAAEKAQGRWLWFLNAGDVISEEYSLSKIIRDLNVFDEFSACIYSVDHVTTFGQFWARSIPIMNFKNGIKTIDCNHQGFICKKNIFDKYGRFDTNLNYAADSKLMDLIVSKEKVQILNDVLVQFSIGGASTKNYTEVIREINKHRNTQLDTKYIIFEIFQRIKTRLRFYLLASDMVFVKTIIGYLSKKRYNKLK